MRTLGLLYLVSGILILLAASSDFSGSAHAAGDDHECCDVYATEAPAGPFTAHPCDCKRNSSGACKALNMGGGCQDKPGGPNCSGQSGLTGWNPASCAATQNNQSCTLVATLKTIHAWTTSCDIVLDPDFQTNGMWHCECKQFLGNAQPQQVQVNECSSSSDPC